MDKLKGLNIVKEFKHFALRGNAIDLGVAFAIATALVVFVRATIQDLITPIFAIIGGESSFASLSFSIKDSRFHYGDWYGDWINSAFVLIVVIAVVFLFVVRPMNAARARSMDEPLDDPSIRVCAECLSEVPAKSTRCKFCTAAA